MELESYWNLFNFINSPIYHYFLGMADIFLSMTSVSTAKCK